MSGEIEFQCFIDKSVKDAFTSIIGFFYNYGFVINGDCSGYYYKDEFQFQNWKSMVDIIEFFDAISSGDFCVNLTYMHMDYKKTCSISITLSFEVSVVSIKINEDLFIDVDEVVFLGERLRWFVDLCEKALQKLDIKFWLIGQSEIDATKHEIFIPCDSNKKYPSEEIDKIINWYNNQYLTRWD